MRDFMEKEDSPIFIKIFKILPLRRIATRRRNFEMCAIVVSKTKHLTLKHRNTQNGSKSTKMNKKRESQESAASSDFD